MAFFAWLAAKGKILTIDNLRKRGIITEDLCCICKYDGESGDRPILHREVARELWSLILSLFFLKFWHAGLFVKEASSEIWEIIPVCNVVYLERKNMQKVK